MTPLLDARAVCLDHRLRRTDLQIAEGQLVGLIGPNGGGKTSLLRAIAGVERTDGTVLIAGEEVSRLPPVRRSAALSFLPASREIAWSIAVKDVIQLGAAAPDARRADELIEALELAPLAARPINSLSTGERARALLARALFSRPKLLLLDEPLSNLDPYWVLKILALLRDAVETMRCCALTSVHDLALASHFDRLLLMDQGRIIADGTASEIIEGPELAAAFRIERDGREWRIRRPAGPRSSP